MRACRRNFAKRWRTASHKHKTDGAGGHIYQLNESPHRKYFQTWSIFDIFFDRRIVVAENKSFPKIKQTGQELKDNHLLLHFYVKLSITNLSSLISMDWGKVTSRGYMSKMMGK